MIQNESKTKQKVATASHQSKRPRKTRTRSSRNKRDTSRFGIRYLHHHMFEDGASDSKQPCPSVECKCGSSMAAVFSGRTIVSLTISVLVLLIGVTFMLVGYIIPRRTVVFIERGDGSRKPVDSTAITFNNLLDDFTLVGTILISIGALLFCVVLLLPICRASNRKGEYHKAPTEETPVSRARAVSSESLSSQPSELERRTSSGTASSTSSLQKIPVLAVVHNVQPKTQHRATTGLHEYRKNANQYKDSFEEED